MIDNDDPELAGVIALSNELLECWGERFADGVTVKEAMALVTAGLLMAARAAVRLEMSKPHTDMAWAGALEAANSESLAGGVVH